MLNQNDSCFRHDTVFMGWKAALMGLLSYGLGLSLCADGGDWVVRPRLVDRSLPVIDRILSTKFSLPLLPRRC